MTSTKKSKTKAKQKSKTLETSSVRVGQILVPLEIMSKLDLSVGQVLGVSLDKDGDIIVDKNPSYADKWTSGISNRKMLALPETFFTEAAIIAGDTVTYDILDENRVKICKVDGTKIDAFTNPELDVNGMPIPPGWLVQAFTGRPDVAPFLTSSDRSGKVIANIVKEAGQDISKFKNIVDFGCGCSRVLRALPQHTKARLIGCDLHKDAIDWCSKHIPNSKFFYGTEFPPIPVEDAEVDLLYAISVLTHLDEEHQDAWLKEWQRVVKPGGLLIITFRAEDFLEKFIPAESGKKLLSQIRKDWKTGSKGFSFVSHSGWKGVFEEFYSDAYHTKEYIEKHWGKYFEIVKLIDAGDFANRQNAAVMRRR